MAEAVIFSVRHPIRTLSLMAAERRSLQKVGKGLRIATPFVFSGALASAFLALTGHPEGMDIAANALIGLGVGEAVARFARNSFSRAFVLGRSEREISELKSARSKMIKRCDDLRAELEEVHARGPEIEAPLQAGNLVRTPDGEIDTFAWQIAAIREEIGDLQVVAHKLEEIKRAGRPKPKDGYISVDTEKRERRWQGGMGETEVMYYLPGGVFVIKKKLLSQHASIPELAARFIREAKIAQQLDHPNIAKGYGYAQNPVPVTRGNKKTVEQELFLMTEFVRGRTLDEIIYSDPEHPAKGIPLPAHQAGVISLQILSALEYMHTFQHSLGSEGLQIGLVHRDLKPGNVMISINRTPDDPAYAKVIDLGLAREMISGAGMTQTGSTLGTPEFMAPEQLRGEKQMTGMVDIYALALIMYEMFEGQTLFSGFERPDIKPRIMDSTRIPLGIKETLVRMLDIRKEQRPAHADIREALEQTLSVLEATRLV